MEYKDNQRLPAQVLMSDFENFDGNNIDLMQRSQLWDCPEKDEILANCKYKIMLSDFMASGLPYKERCAMLTEWLETTLELFPDCVAVWTPSSGKLLTREQVLNNPWAAPTRFLHFGMNIRLFNIQNTNDMMVDTLGLYAIGLPDIQYHFHDLDPNAVVNHAYNAAAYIFDTDASIKDGETIDGISEQDIDRSIQWKCQYERSSSNPTGKSWTSVPTIRSRRKGIIRTFIKNTRTRQQQSKTKKHMKVIAINGSPHPQGNTFHALKTIGEELKKKT